MEHNHVFISEYSLPRSSGEPLLESEFPGWQPFSSQNKYHKQHAELFNPKILQFPSSTPEKIYDLERNLSSAAYTGADNSDFLSAIPYARSSYTVKRKLDYHDENIELPNTVQKTKTYFPFEFVGRATRSTSSIESDEKENSGIIHPMMVTGHALRRLDVNGSAFQTFTTQSETPVKLNKKEKHKPKRRTNQQAALEKHVEQIRRKHAEFNWDTSEPEQKFGKFQENGLLPNDVDSQRVPTSPFLERYTPPSFYSLSEPLVNPLPWMKRHETSTSYGGRLQNYENVMHQPYFKKESTSLESWSQSTGEFPGNMSNETQNVYLYPY